MLGLDVRQNATLFNGSLTSGDAFEQFHTFLKQVVTFDVYKVGAWPPMFGDQNWFPMPVQFGQEFSSPTLECGDEFSSHRVIL